MMMMIDDLLMCDVAVVLNKIRDLAVKRSTRKCPENALDKEKGHIS